MPGALWAQGKITAVGMDEKEVRGKKKCSLFVLIRVSALLFPWSRKADGRKSAL